MFAKLAFRNVRRSVKDYSVYFLTLLLGVCLFYVFNSLQGQPVVVMLNQSAQTYVVEAILEYMNVLSVFVSVVLAGLVLYANNFMLRRRKKELATYLLLGLPQHKLALMLFLETLAVGLLALVLGILLGALAANGLSVLMLGLFALPYEELLGFRFQWDAVGKTALYFGLIFLAVMVFNQVSVARQQLGRLMSAGRQNEELKQRPVWFSVLVFLAGVVLIVIAYALLLIRGMLRIDAVWLLMLVMGAVGTVFFFRGLSGFVLQLCRANEGLYLKGLNMFVLRQWSGKIHTTYLSMTVVCLLLLLAIGATACTIGMNDAIAQISAASAPFDFTLTNHSYGGSGDGLRPLDFTAELAGHGFDTGSLAAEVEFSLYSNEQGEDFITLSDYNALMAAQGLPALSGDGLPAVRRELLFTHWGSGTGCSVLEGREFVDGYWVIPDSETAGLTRWRHSFCGNYPAGAGALAWDNALSAALEQIDDLSAATRHEMYLEQLGAKVMVLFIGVYLGVTFLITAAAVLALQQLSQTADNVGQYLILRRLGAEEGMRSKAVFFQVFLAFFLPLALAVVHAAVGMTAANQVIAMVSQGNLDTVYSSFLTAGLILLIYGAYFLLTFFSSRRILRGRE